MKIRYGKAYLYILLPYTVYASSNVVVSELCETIHARTYFLERLDALVTTIAHAENALGITSVPHEPYNFEHPLMQDVAARVDAQHTLEPYITLWRALKQYQYISDQSLVREFVRYTLAITRAIYQIIHASPPQAHARHLDFYFNLANASYTELITLRFYYATRVKKAVSLLKTLRCKRDSFFEFSSSDETCNCIFSSQVQFSHKDILTCIHRMEKESTLDALIHLARGFSTYRLLRDEVFTKEFILLILCVYKNLIANNTQSAAVPSRSLDRITNTYETIQSLPLEQILATIDVLTNDLPYLLQHYHFYSYKSWKRWLKKYWWVPPVLGVTIAAKVALQFRRPSYFPGRDFRHFDGRRFDEKEYR